MISINATLILQVIHFLILTFILNRLMFRPILKLIDERTRYIEKTKEEAESIEWETRQLNRKAVTMEKDTRKNAVEERFRMQREAKEMSEKIFNDTRKEVSVIRDEVIDEIEEKVQKAQESLYREAVVLADEITQRFLDRRI